MNRDARTPRIRRTDALEEFEHEKKKLHEKIKRRRRKLIDRIEEQIGLARAMLTGEPYSKFRKLWTSDEDGNRVYYERPTKLQPWWWDDGTGTYYIHIWYGHKILNLPDGSKTIQVGDGHNLLETFSVVIDAVSEGSFDQAIMKSSNRGLLDYYLSMPAQRLEREKHRETTPKPDLTKNFEFLRPGLKKKMLKILEMKRSPDPIVKAEPESLKLLTAVRNENRTSRQNILRFRKILVERIEEQIGLANKILYEIPYVKMRTVWQSDKAGNRSLVERPKTIKPWWDMGDDRRYYIQVRYDNRILTLPDGSNTIHVGPLNMLVEQFYGLIDAVTEGQFDEAMLSTYDEQAIRYLLTVPLRVIKQKKADLEKANKLRFEESQEKSKLNRRRKKHRYEWRKSDPIDK